MLKFKSKEIKTIISSFSYLSILSISQYVFPLITFPYLVRVLGPEQFGLLAFAQSFIQYFSLVVDYGFNLTATRQISIHRRNLDKISEIFSLVIAARLTLLILCFLLMSFIVYCVPMFRSVSAIYYASFIGVLGTVLFPSWFFQGMEKMKYIAAPTIIARIITLVFIFVFIQKPSDYILAAVIQSAGSVLVGIIGLGTAYVAFPIILKVPTIRRVKLTLIDGWHVFISQISTSLFSTSNIFILGLFASNIQVGYFAIADKIVRAVVALISPVSMAVYPAMSTMIFNSRSRALLFLQKLLVYGGIAFLLFSLFLFFGSDCITYLVAGEYNNNIALLIRILSILPVTIFIVNVYGTQIMLNVGMQKQFMNIMIAIGVFSIASSFILVPFFAERGTAAVSLSSEILEMILIITMVQKSGINLFRKR